MPRRRLIIFLLAFLFIAAIAFKSDLNKKEGRSHFIEGKAYYEQGLFREALKEFEFAQNFNYSNKELFLLAGNASLFIKRYEDAEYNYKKLISADKEDFFAMNQLGLAYIYEKKYSDAIDILKKSLEYKPEFTGTLILLGRAYQLSGMLAESAATVDLAIRQDNNIMATGTAEKMKETSGLQKIYHNSKAWLESEKMPLLKPMESAFPVLLPGPYEQVNGWYSRLPDVYLLSLSDRPVYYRFGQSGTLKIFGLPFKARQGINRLSLGIPPSYRKIEVENLPIMQIDLKTVNIKVDIKKKKVYAVWPRPLSVEYGVDRIQVGLETLYDDISGNLDSIFKVYRLSGLKSVKGKVRYDRHKKIIYFVPQEKYLKKGRYIVYVSPRLKNVIGNNNLSKAKVWSFSVTENI